MKQIAFFDFDGTITTKDTLLEFIKYSKGNFRFCFGFLVNSPFLVAYKIGLLSNQRAKEKILSFFFGKKKIQLFQQYCDDFADTIIPGLIRPKALHEIRQLQARGIDVVILSASAENWLEKWCRLNNISLIATKLERNQDVLTGKIAGLNCYGKEKVRRIHEVYDLEEYNCVYAYGDTKGDKPFLALATFSFYKPFR